MELSMHIKLNGTLFIYIISTSLFFHSLPDIIRQIKSRGMRWAGHVTRMGEGRNVYRVWWESSKEKDHLEDRGVDGRTGSIWTLGRLVGEEGIHLARDRDRRAVVNAVMNPRVLAPRS
jgi:hypothetical protein